MYKKVNYSAEFAKRTRSILRDCFSEEYEVTQLINSMVGLLIIPEQKEYKNIDDNYISNELLNKLQKCSKPSSVDFRTIIHRMRNAVAHSRIEFIGEKQSKDGNMEIQRVRFKDKNQRNSSDVFEIELCIDDLKKLLYEFTDSIIKNEKTLCNK